MAEVCISCKEPEFDPEEQVCKACGVVSEDMKFGFSTTDHSSYLPSTSSKSMNKKYRQPTGLKVGIDCLHLLVRMYNVSTYIRDEVCELFKEIHSSKSSHIKQDIKVMAGCCLIYVLRTRYNQFVPINDLCRKLNCAKKSVTKCFKIIKMVKPHQPLKQEADGGLSGNSDANEGNLQALKTAIDFTVESFPEEDKVPLIEKTTELVKLAFSLWLGTGRSMEGLVVASVFLCWKSLHPSRKTVPLSKFCQNFSLDGKKARVKISELYEMLLKLGQKIPSLTENYVNAKNVLFHLDYILKNSTTLRNDIHSEEFDPEEISKKEFAMFRKPPVQTAKLKYIEPSIYDSSMCASDIEISDTEINSYIRSEEQVKIIKELRDLKKVKKEHEDEDSSHE